MGVTLKLLHGEYADSCAAAGEPTMGYDRFCRTYQRHVLVTGTASRVGHKAGQTVEVDWSGSDRVLHPVRQERLAPAAGLRGPRRCDQGPHRAQHRLGRYRQPQHARTRHHEALRKRRCEPAPTTPAAGPHRQYLAIYGRRGCISLYNCGAPLCMSRWRLTTTLDARKSVRLAETFKGDPVGVGVAKQFEGLATEQGYAESRSPFIIWTKTETLKRSP